MLIILPLIIIIITLVLIAFAVFIPKKFDSNIKDLMDMFESELQSTNILIQENKETIKKLKSEIKKALQDR